MDSTSAPSAWLVAALFVSEFLSRTRVYEVPSNLALSDYSAKEIAEEGNDTRIVGAGSRESSVLVDLISSKGLDYVLFQEFYNRSKE